MVARSQVAQYEPEVVPVGAEGVVIRAKCVPFGGYHRVHPVVVACRWVAPGDFTVLPRMHRRFAPCKVEVPPVFRTVSIRLSTYQPALLGRKAEAVVLDFDLLWRPVSEP